MATATETSPGGEAMHPAEAAFYQLAEAVRVAINAGIVSREAATAFMDRVAWDFRHDTADQPPVQ